MTSSTTAIWLGDDGRLSKRNISESYVPVGAESLVKIMYSGINPADQKHFLMGLHSFVAGYEFSGIVVSAGPHSQHKPGDAIFGMNRAQHQRKAALGAHQEFAIAEPQAFFKLPSGMKLEHAAAMALVSHTAMDGLFNCLGFGFPVAGISGPNPSNVPILIWGGASGVGMAAIQIAKAAGFSPIITTSSNRHHLDLLELGATHCFDYKSPTVVKDVRSVIAKTGNSLSVVFDTVVDGADPLKPPEQRLSFSESTPALAKSCCFNSHADELKLVSVLPVAEDPSYKHAMCWRPIGELDYFGKQQDPELPLRVRKAMDWLVQNHQEHWRIPHLRVVKGVAAGIESMYQSAAGAVSFEKIVLEHPL